MTVREICNYIEMWDYIDYRKYLYETFGNKVKRLMMSKYRYRRHKMHALAIDMVARGEYYG